MNDNESHMKDEQKPTFSNFIKFLQAVKSKTTCPSCDQIGWSVESVWDDDDADLMSAITGIPFAEIPASDELELTSTEQRGLPTISLICSNCGFVRQHSYVIFRKWLNAQQELKDTSQEGPDGE
ncbi:hypothetical protein A9K76_15670 [Stenotrophomonas maltophilia]|nr:hypothetical protein A9K76_15670 [Stenotrophomonas maltophilia]